MNQEKTKKRKIIEYQFILIFIIFGTFCSVQNSEAKDIYVSTTGDDSVEYINNDISHPWLTIEKAWADAQTDDIVYYRAGTYNIETTINVADSGHNVHHLAYNGEEVLWASSLAATTIEIGEPDITVDGIDIQSATSGGDAGFFRIGWNSNGLSPSGFTLRNCTGTTTGYGDNTGFVHARPNGGGYAENTTIENCTFIGPGADVGADNATAIIMFEGRNWTIKNCEIKNIHTGIFFNKHANDASTSGGLVQNCYVHDVSIALLTQTNHTDFINNILVGVFRMGYDSGPCTTDGNIGSDFNTFSHNTIITPAADASFEMQNHTRSGDNEYVGSTNNAFENNIIQALMEVHRYTVLPHDTSDDYNLLRSGNVANNNSTTLDLSGWRTHLGGCPGDGNACNSISGTPLFTGGSTFNQAADYALASGAAGYRSASDGTDMGADVSLVGPNAIISEDTTAPSTPSGLSVS